MSRAKTITVTASSLAVGAILATGITGIASAANQAANSTPNTVHSSQSPSSPSSPSSTAPGGQQDGHRGGGHGGDHGMMGVRGDALHGEVVVKAADGTISTVRMINGAVTAVSASSITVKASDGFTATYTVTSTTDVHAGLPTRGQGHDAASSASGSTTKPAASTIADVKVGDVAQVEGTVSGSTVTATEIRSMTAAQAAQLDQLRAQHDQAEQQAGTAGSTPSSSSAA